MGDEPRDGRPWRDLPRTSGAREFFEQLFALETGESIHVEVEEITEASDDQASLGLLAKAQGRGSGVPTELRLWQAFWFGEGLITRRQVFWTRQEALEAALSEAGPPLAR